MDGARTGVFLEDYLEYSSSLPAEIQRLLSTIKDLDERSQWFISQAGQQTKYYLQISSSMKNNEDEDDTIKKLKKEIEENQNNALRLSNEKINLAQQAQDLINSYIKRLDEDLNDFSEDLKQEGKLHPDEPTILPLRPLVPKIEKQKQVCATPQSKRFDYKEKKSPDKGFVLMPPPGGLNKDFAISELYKPINPNEPTYCVCNQVSFGEMIACDNDNCEGGEWFHYACVGLTLETRYKGMWYCPTCTKTHGATTSQQPQM